MARRIHALALAAASLSALAGVAHADIAPPPNYIAGLWFMSPRVYTAPAHPTQGPPILYDCQAQHPNCALARKLGVVGAIVASINGIAGQDPTIVFSAPNPPPTVQVVFKRTTAAGKPVYTTVTFASR